MGLEPTTFGLGSRSVGGQGEPSEDTRVTVEPNPDDRDDRAGHR